MTMKSLGVYYEVAIDLLFFINDLTGTHGGSFSLLSYVHSTGFVLIRHDGADNNKNATCR